MSQTNLCRLCINTCKDYYKELYEDVEVYETTVKYFDPMFLNMKHHLTAICLECWYHMVDFHQFQLSVVQAQTKLVKEHKSGGVVVKSELLEFPENLCRFCVNICNDIRLNDDPEIFDIVARYFDSKLWNMKGITGICLECWSHILDFHNFQESVLQAQTKLVKNEQNVHHVIVKSEVSELLVDHHPECANVKEGTNVNNAFIEETYRVTVISEQDHLREHDDTSVVIKEEPEFFTLPELELIDIHSESQFSSDHERPLTDSVMQGNASAAKSDTCMDYEDIDSSNDEDDEDDDPTRKTYEKRKSNQELDDIIAHWRPTLECVLCQVSCETFTLLQKHFESMHPREKVHIFCCQCKLRTHYYVEEHIRFHADPNIFKCQICGQCNTTRLRLKRHMDYWHSATCKPTPADKSSLICKECGNTAKTVGALRKHMHRHEAKRKFKCAICDKGYRGRNDLRTHLATHAQEYACPHCPMTFKYLSRLRGHQNKEHGDLGSTHEVKC